MTLSMELKEQKREVRKEGLQDGIAPATLASIRSLMETVHRTAKQAIDALKIPRAEQERYVSRL